MPTDEQDERPNHPEPFDLALLEHYSRKPNWKRFRGLVEIAAEAGDPLALNTVATWHIHGNKDVGIAKQPAKAFPLLKRAAPYFGRAAYNFAICYFQGAGTRRNERAGFQWLEKAAELGDVQALRELAVCLEEGYGVKPNPRRATAYQKQYDKLRAKLDKLGPASPKRAR